jgi:hypothetical protein
MARGDGLGLRWPVSLRRMRVQRGVLAAVALTVALAAASATALAAYATQATGAAVKRTVADDTQAPILFSGSVPAAAQSGAAGAETSDAGIAAATQGLRSLLVKALGGIPVTLYSSPELESLGLPGSTENAGRVTTLLGPSDLPGHARLLHGTWPSGGAAAGTPLPVALTETGAVAMGLSVGSRLTVALPAGAHRTVEVSGIFAPLHAADPYWSLDALGGSGRQQSTGFTTFGPLYTDPSYLTQASAEGGAFGAQQMEWEAVPDAAAVGTAGLAETGANLQSLLTGLAQNPAYGGPQTSTNLPQVLVGLASAVTVARSLVLAELLELFVAAAAALLIVVRLLTEVRETEAALLWARGGTGRQLVVLRSVESLMLAAPAIVVAPLLARPLASVIGRIGAADPGAVIGIASLNGVAWSATWAAVAAAVLLAFAVILAPAFASAVSPVALRAKRSRERPVTVLGRAGIDLGLVVLAVIACWRLLGAGSIVGTDLSGQPSYDPVSIAAPALALAAGAVVLMRLLPVAARLGERVARRGRNLAFPLALWQTGRKSLRLGGPLLLATLAVAVCTLSLAEFDSARVSAQDQAAFSTGSDLDVSLGTTVQPSAKQLAAIAAQPGVTGVTAVSRTVFVPSADASGQATLLALDTATAARTVLLRPDLAQVPLSTLVKQIAAPLPGGVVPALETSAYASLERVFPGDTTALTLGSATVQLKIVGVVKQFPTIATGDGGLVVGEHAVDAALAAAGQHALATSELWIRDAGGRIPGGLPAGSTTVRRVDVATALRDAPLAEEPTQVLLAVAGATVLLALCGLAVGVLSGGGERQGEFALLAALGLSRGGRIRLRVLEQALLAVPGALAGLCLGVLLARVVVPVATLNASALPPQPPVLVHIPWAVLCAAAAVFTAVPLLLAAFAGARQRDTAIALREGTDR